MKLKNNFEAVGMGNEFIYVPVGDDADNVHGVLRLNSEGKEILELLKEDITEEQIVDRLAEKYENTRDQLKDWVAKVMCNLRDAGLIKE